MNVPKLLTMLSGEAVTNVEVWERFRREEILQLFCDHVYGRRDMECPDDESFVLVKEETVCGMQDRKCSSPKGDH